MKMYKITEKQLKVFVDALERYYGDHRVHTSTISLSYKFDPPPEGFEEQIQFWIDGEIEIELSLKELKIIENCNNCSHLDKSKEEHPVLYCKKEDSFMSVRESEEIPKWCKLPRAN